MNFPVQQLGDSSSDVFSSFLQTEEQTIEQFTNMFESIVTSFHSDGDASNSMDGMLSYLQSRESEIVNEVPGTADNHSFSTVDQAISSQSPAQSTFSNGRLQCLDVMLNHLEAREISLECSPEYSVELILGGSSQVIESEIDNRFHQSNSSEIGSSDGPDNDKSAALIENSTECSHESGTSCDSENIEEIFLTAPSDESSESSSMRHEIHTNFMEQPVNLKVDNFVTDNYCYDSDKDIDESETVNDNSEDFVLNHSYLPSFHKNESAECFSEVYPSSCANVIRESFENIELDRDDTTIRNELVCSGGNISDRSVLSTPLINNEHALPGEISDFDYTTEEYPCVHVRSQNFRNISADESSGIITCSNLVQDHVYNDLVEPFHLESNFDYDNVLTTPRFSHYL